MAKKFEWRGKTIRTIGDLGDTIISILDDGTQEEARKFMDAYKNSNPYAESNIGYLAGYYDRETARKIWDWFNCSHPIFGRI